MNIKEKFAKDILNRLIENKLILTYAKDNNIKANEEEVKKQLEGFKKSFKNSFKIRHHCIIGSIWDIWANI